MCPCAVVRCACPDGRASPRTQPSTSTARRSNPQPRPGHRTYPQRWVRSPTGVSHTNHAASMNIWTLTTTADRQHTIIGAAASADQARERAAAGARSAIAHAGNAGPRYTLHIDGQLVVIIATCDDDDGLPDHAAAADLLTYLNHLRNPFSH
jgi:hypothetical protein